MASTPTIDTDVAVLSANTNILANRGWFSADGSKIALYRADVANGPYTLDIFDASGALVARTSAPRQEYSATLTADGSHFALLGARGTLIVYDTAGGTPTSLLVTGASGLLFRSNPFDVPIVAPGAARIVALLTDAGGGGATGFESGGLMGVASIDLATAAQSFRQFDLRTLTGRPDLGIGEMVLAEGGGRAAIDTTAGLAVVDTASGALVSLIQGLGEVRLVAADPAGSRLLVETTATLMPGDSDTLSDLYVLDAATGRVVSRVDTGMPDRKALASGNLAQRAIFSADGSTFWLSAANELVDRSYPLQAPSFTPNQLYRVDAATGLIVSEIRPGAQYAFDSRGQPYLAPTLLMDATPDAAKLLFWASGLAGVDANSLIYPGLASATRAFEDGRIFVAHGNTSTDPPLSVALFTPSSDTVDLGQIDLSTAIPGGTADARDGNDAVTLSGTQNIGVPFFGNGGNDTITGSVAADVIVGDVWRGGRFAPVLVSPALEGTVGNDDLAGGAGNDTFYVDGGFDAISGGERDRPATATSPPIDGIDTGYDTVVLAGGTGDWEIRTQGDAVGLGVAYLAVSGDGANASSVSATGAERLVVANGVTNVVGAQVIPGQAAPLLNLLSLAAELAGRAYDTLGAFTGDTRNWHPMTAIELGMPTSWTGSDGPRGGFDPAWFPATLYYETVDGLYQARAAGGDPQDLFSPIQAAVTGPNTLGAVVATGVVNGKTTLALAFRGTDEVADARDFLNFAGYVEKARPLLWAIQDYIDLYGIEQVLVTGHSLGGAAAAMLAADTAPRRPGGFTWSSDKVQVVTFGSPGIDPGTIIPDDGRILNVRHTDDPVTLLSTDLAKGLSKAIADVAVDKLLKLADSDLKPAISDSPAVIGAKVAGEVLAQALKTIAPALAEVTVPRGNAGLDVWVDREEAPVSSSILEHRLEAYQASISDLVLAGVDLATYQADLFLGAGGSFAFGTDQDDLLVVAAPAAIAVTQRIVELGSSFLEPLRPLLDTLEFFEEAIDDAVPGSGRALNVVNWLGKADAVLGFLSEALPFVVGGDRTDKAQRIYAGKGDDIITGYGGNDTINGGAGTDRVVFLGNQADYLFRKAADGSVTVSSLRGGDGTDLLVEVEQIGFGDTVLVPVVTSDGTSNVTKVGYPPILLSALPVDVTFDPSVGYTLPIGAGGISTLDPLFA